MSHRCNNQPIDVNEILIPPYPTQFYQIKISYQKGKEAARNHYYGEDTVDLPYGVKSWNVYPYQVTRPSAYYSWLAGFHEEFANLVREFGEFQESDGES